MVVIDVVSEVGVLVAVGALNVVVGVVNFTVVCSDVLVNCGLDVAARRINVTELQFSCTFTKLLFSDKIVYSLLICKLI